MKQNNYKEKESSSKELFKIWAERAISNKINSMKLKGNSKESEEKAHPLKQLS
jgi:hypothetical protein